MFQLKFSSSKYNRYVTRCTVSEKRRSIRWTQRSIGPTKRVSLEISLERTVHSYKAVNCCVTSWSNLEEDTDREGLESSGMWRCTWRFECSLTATALRDTGSHTLDNTVLGTWSLSGHASYTSYACYASCTSFQIPDHLLEIFSNILFKEKQTRDLKNKRTSLILYLTLHMPLLKQRRPSN